MTDPGLVRDCREVLSHHARSFRWGAAFLPADRHDQAAVVYAFCRMVDDLADETPDPAAARVALEQVQRELDQGPRSELVEAFVQQCSDPVEIGAAQDLIHGALSDLPPRVVQTDEELLHYCYQVAGTVGLMMCGVLGVEEPAARPYAVELGIAMQLTNIARDVREDAAMGRVYLPAARLRAAGIAPDDLRNDQVDRSKLAKVVAAILELAEEYYRRGEAGLAFIPARPRLAIVVAARVYRSIGRKLRRQGCDAWAGRTIVSPMAKLVPVTQAMASWMLRLRSAPPQVAGTAAQERWAS